MGLLYLYAGGIRVGTLIRNYRRNCWDPTNKLTEMATLLIFIQKELRSNLGCGAGGERERERERERETPDR
jgi:hypothetical protein